MATSALGTTERTNELLAEASKVTGVAAPAFPTTEGVATPQAGIVPGVTMGENINTVAPQGQDFTIAKKESYPSSALVGGRTVSEIMKKRSELEQAAINANKPSELELDLSEQLNQVKQLSRRAQLDLNRETERLQTSGMLTKDISQQWTSETARSFQRTLGDLGVSASGLADALNAEIAKRGVNVDAATTLLKYDQENISLLQDLQKMTQPEVIGSPQVNEMTGEVTVFKQDPQTGAIVAENIGNVGASKKFIQTGTRKNDKGEDVFWGLKPDGTIEQITMGANDSRVVDPSKIIERETNLRKEFASIPVVKEAVSVQTSNNQIVSAYNAAIQAGNDKASKAAADQVLVVSFNKMIDPASVVREGEFARSTEGQSAINRLQGKVQQYLQGGVGLTDADRKSIVDMTKTLYKDYVRSHNAEAIRFRGFAEEQGVSPDNVAGFLPTAGVIDPKTAKDGDILILDGKPFIKQGDQMVEVEADPDEVSFNSVGGDTDIASIKNAIAQIESGGRYDAVSPVNRNGKRAYGKFQIMETNIPSWTKEALGKSLTVQEFLRNPEAQEKTAEYQMAKIYKQYGNPDDVAAVWFSGRPLKGNTSSDVTGTSVPTYVSRFRKNLTNS